MPRKSKKESESLEMIMTIIPKGKGAYFLKMYDRIDCSCQTSMPGLGTADSMMLGLFGLADLEKDVIFTLIKKSDIEKVFSVLDNELEMNKGIAFSIPLSGVVGKSVYMFLTNQRGDYNGK